MATYPYLTSGLRVACLVPIALAVTVASLVCVLAAGDSGTPDQWGTPVQGIAISVSVERDSYRVGEPVALIVKRRNVGTTPHQLARTWLTDEYDMGVALPSGKPAPRTLYSDDLKWRNSLAGAGMIELLRPGVTDIASFPLNRLFDMTLEGRYRATARLRVPDASAASKWLTVESNSIFVTVTAGETETPRWLDREFSTTPASKDPPQPAPAP